MTKRNFATALSALALLVFAQTGAAAEPETAMIYGKANFEKRSTVVPMAVCENEPCPKPTAYWSLVVIDGDVRYEVNQIFAFGSQKCPAEVEIAGARITRGARVAIEGRVQTLGSDYRLITDVTRATVLPDEAEESIETRSEGFLPNLYGWWCVSQDPRAAMAVDILYRGTDPAGEKYEIVVSHGRGNAPKNPIASAPDSLLQFESDQIVFRGRAESAIIQVMINRMEDRVSDLPAYLTLARRAPGAFMVYDMRCSRTRL